MVERLQREPPRDTGVSLDVHGVDGQCQSFVYVCFTFLFRYLLTYSVPTTLHKKPKGICHNSHIVLSLQMYRENEPHRRT